MPRSKKPKPTKSKPNKKEIFKKGRPKIERTDNKPADGELSIEELGKVVVGRCRGCGGGPGGCRSCRLDCSFMS